MILEDAEAFGADLIVVGSHGHGMLECFLLGSVSQALSLRARCSVPFVRNPDTQARASQSWRIGQATMFVGSSVLPAEGAAC